MTRFPGQETFKSRVVHSSDLDSLTEHDVEGKNVIVIGSGASGVEVDLHCPASWFSIDWLFRRQPNLQ